MFLRFFIHHVESQGISELSLRARLNLGAGGFDSLPEAELVARGPRLLEVAEHAVGDELLCLHAGERFHFCLAGLGGLVATHAPTPGMALETFGRFVDGQTLLDVERSTALDATTLAPRVLADWPSAVRESFLDGYFSSLVAALRAVCGSSFAPLEIRLARTRPNDRKSYERALRGKVTFGATRDEIKIRTPDLTMPSLLYEPLLYEQLRFTVDLAAEQPSGAGPMRQLVEQAVRAGEYSVERVAATLRIKRRTLQRRLQTEGSTFRGVLNEVRVGLAQKLLLETDLSLTATAERLDYSDDKGLRKAIRNVTGKAPGQIRREG
jgi:AraC-like DNA-binding protein